MSAVKVILVNFAIILTLCQVHLTLATRNVNISTKIVGGNETTIQEYPYAVSIRNTFYAGRYEKNICCGSIISEEWVLTSAHCVNGFKQNCSNLAVRVGKENNNQGKIHSVSEVVVHPQYSYSKVPKHNIAILKVQVPFVYSIRIQPVKIATVNFIPTSGALASVVGWGASEEGGNDFVFLHQVSVPIIPEKECTTYFTDYEDYDGSEVINDDVFCAGFKEGWKGFCENDKGGPLVYNSTQVGIVSWSSGCADEDYPGVYTNVSFFSEWISSVTGIKLHNDTTPLPSPQGSIGGSVANTSINNNLLLLISSLALVNMLNFFQLPP